MFIINLIFVITQTFLGCTAITGLICVLVNHNKDLAKENTGLALIAISIAMAIFATFIWLMVVSV